MLPVKDIKTNYRVVHFRNAFKIIVKVSVTSRMSSLLYSPFKRFSNNRKDATSKSSNAESVISTKASEVNDNGNNVIITLERVSSKGDVYEGSSPAKKGSITVLRKRNTSSKEEELLEVVAPAMKRSNSKTDVKGDEEITTVVVVSKPAGKRKSFVVPGLIGLEQATNNEEKLAHAIQVAKQYHCAEGLEFLQALRKWEELDAGKKKSAAWVSLQNTFIKEKSPHEVCLPTALRNRMSKGEFNNQDILEAKRCIFNDIRFNERVLHELLS